MNKNLCHKMTKIKFFYKAFHNIFVNLLAFVELQKRVKVRQNFISMISHRLINVHR